MEIESMKWDVNLNSDWDTYCDNGENDSCDFYPCDNKATRISRLSFPLLVNYDCGTCSGRSQMKLCDTCLSEHMKNMEISKEKGCYGYIMQYKTKKYHKIIPK